MFCYFDLGNVLLFFSHRRAAEQLARLAECTADEVWKFAFASDVNHRCDAGRLNAREFRDLFREQFDVSHDDATIRHAASDIFTANTPMIDIVQQLKQSGLRVGVLSNTCDMHVEWLVEQRRFPPLPEVFDVHVYSYRERLMKPDRSIYELAAQRAGVEPNEVLYVDDLEANVLGARAAGFDAVVYTSPESFRAALVERGVRLM